jgi:hypothetical protein
MRSLRHAKKDKVISKADLINICRWKSPRAIRHIKFNRPGTVKALTRKALSTRSEQKRIDHLTQLRGVKLPMASAILTLVNPKRYGVIDIRVWQLLYAIKSVTKKPKGVNFNFKDWYHYLCKLQFYAKELEVPIRTIERTLFLYHKKLQKGTLYGEPLPRKSGK